MTCSELPSITVSRRGAKGKDSDGCTVVWLRGEHDIATRVSVVAGIARATQHNDTDVVVDLSGVTFMDASTIGALVESGNRLRPRSHSLHVRAPCPPAIRVLDLCGHTGLVQHASAPAFHPPARRPRSARTGRPSSPAARSSY